MICAFSKRCILFSVTTYIEWVGREGGREGRREGRKDGDREEGREGHIMLIRIACIHFCPYITLPTACLNT